MKFLSTIGLALVSCSTLILVGCQESGPIVNVEAEQQLIAEISQRWADAESRKDLEASLVPVWDHATWLPPDAEVVEGIEAIRELFEDFFDQVPYSSLTIEPTRITVSASGDLAYNWGNFTLGFDGPDGTSSVTLKFLATWGKYDGEWKVTSNMFSYNSPKVTQ